MADTHFISYSSADALDFALKLANALIIGPPSFKVWLDKRELRFGDDWDSQIAEAIKQCESMIFVMSRDSVEDESVCKQEWTGAFRYKKPVTPLLLHRDAEMPFRFGSRQFIDFTGDFAIGLAKLQNHLTWLVSPAGQLQALKDRLADARRDLRRAAGETDRARIADEIALLEQQIAQQQAAVERPQEVAQRVQESIEAGLERQRQPERPVGGAARTKFINPPPAVVPGYFQDRAVETGLMADFLRDDALRLLTVVGRGGIGKTATVVRLLRGIERGQLPDDLGPFPVAGIVYLSQAGSRRVTFPNLFADLCRLLPAEQAGRLDALYRDPKVSAGDKMASLLAALPAGPVVLLLDNLEDLLDEGRALRDGELDEVLRVLLRADGHGVKAIITTRVPPGDLLLEHPERQQRLDLDEGLASPYAENILRAMDRDGKVGLRDAPAGLLATARERTRGYPRALEALFGILSADRDTSLPEVLAAAAAALPEHVVEVLVGEAYSRLDRSAQLVMEALAVYGRPAPAVALDFLLQPYEPGANAGPVLSRLVNMHFVRRERGLYYLHQVDRSYALSRISADGAGGRGGASQQGRPGYTQPALLRRAAQYFAETRRARQEWRSLDDLAPQLAEIDLRCAAGDYDDSAGVLREIDFDYLLLWGHYALLVALHERLLAGLDDPWRRGYSFNALGLACSSMGQVGRAIEQYEQALGVFRRIGARQAEGAALGNLGNAYAALGQVGRAIEQYEQALAISREIGDRRGEGADLGNLGLAYADLGQVGRAIAQYEQALVISREIGDRRGEGNHLGALGLAYADLGQVGRAIEQYEQALVISREIGDRRNMGIGLANLGNAYAALGQVGRAIEQYEQALVISREIGDRYIEALALAYDGFVSLDAGNAPVARERCSLARAIAIEIDNAECRSEGAYGLALAHLLAGDLAAARAMIEEAAAVPYPLHGPRVAALQGLIALRQGDRAAAAMAFDAAAEKARQSLASTPDLVAARDSLGLATAGLALLAAGETDARGLATAAAAAYRAARAVTSAAGVTGRAVRLLDALAVADAQGLLPPVRAAAAGEAAIAS